RFHVSFFFIDPSPSETYSLSLHDALPISGPFVGGQRVPGGPHVRELRMAAQWRDRLGVERRRVAGHVPEGAVRMPEPVAELEHPDRKSTRLDSSHVKISYAFFCMKKKKKK